MSSAQVTRCCYRAGKSFLPEPEIHRPEQGLPGQYCGVDLIPICGKFDCHLRAAFERHSPLSVRSAQVKVAGLASVAASNGALANILGACDEGEVKL